MLGAGLLEMGIIVGLIVVLCITGVRLFGQATREKVCRSANAVGAVEKGEKGTSQQTAIHAHKGRPKTVSSSENTPDRRVRGTSHPALLLCAARPKISTGHFPNYSRPTRSKNSVASVSATHYPCLAYVTVTEMLKHTAA
jgi:hypothetical protein